MPLHVQSLVGRSKHVHPPCSLSQTKPLCTRKSPPNTSSEEQLALALNRKNTCESHQFVCQQTGGVRAQCAIQPWWTVAAVKKTSQRCTRTRNSGEGAPESLAFFFFFFGASLPSYIPSQMTQDTGWKTNCNTMLTVASGVCAAQRADARKSSGRARRQLGLAGQQYNMGRTTHASLALALGDAWAPEAAAPAFGAVARTRLVLGAHCAEPGFTYR